MSSIVEKGTDVAQKKPMTERFMRATGRLRMFFGPADQGVLDGEPKHEDEAGHQRRQRELRQWDVVRNADGSTYLVARDSKEDTGE